jgi:hypothetical protein
VLSNYLSSQILLAEQGVRCINGKNRKQNYPEVTRLGRDTQLASVQHLHGSGDSIFIHEHSPKLCVTQALPVSRK